MKKAFEPFADNNSTMIILGTMPGEKSLQLQEYYGNRGNQFWRIMFAVFDEPFTLDYAAKLDFLKRNGIAIWDVLEHCEREGSLDSNIKNEVPNDFAAFYAKFPNIKRVYFSSKNAAAFYDKYVGKKEHLSYATLPSPSGANASMPYAEKLEIWKEKILGIKIL